ncbi:transposase [Trichonephila clavipes]|nr:transposase [Trichonephila clavipes]
MMDRISICKALAKRREIDPFLKQMVTGDEKWVTYYIIVRKRSWSKCGEAAQMVAKPGLTARKVLLCTSYSPEPLGAWLGSFNASTIQSGPGTKQLPLFLSLQKFLSDKKLGSREDWENRLLDVFANKDQDFFERGLMKLPLKWQEIMQLNGAYLTQIG